MNSSKTATWYVALWIIYYLQGTLYASGGIISRLLLAIIMLISGVYFIKANLQRKRPTFLKVLNLFLLMFTVHGVIYLLSDVHHQFRFSPEVDIPRYYYLKNIYCSFLPIYVFFYFTRKNIVTEQWIKNAFIFLLILAIFRFRNEYAIRAGESEIEVTNNSGYQFVALLPLVFFWKSKTLMQYAFLFVCLLFIIWAMKRGAMLIGACCIAYFIKKNISTASGTKRAAIVLLTMLTLVIGGLYIINFMSSSEYFQQRIESTMEGNTSGRNILFLNILNYFINEATTQQLLTGAGANHTVAIAGNYAHCDWLELGVNNGLLGVFVYFLYFATLLSYRKYLKKNKEELRYMVLTSVLIIISLSSIFSMSYGSLSIPSVIAIGYCMGKTSELTPEKKPIKE